MGGWFRGWFRGVTGRARVGHGTAILVALLAANYGHSMASARPRNALFFPGISSSPLFLLPPT